MQQLLVRSPGIYHSRGCIASPPCVYWLGTLAHAVRAAQCCTRCLAPLALLPPLHPAYFLYACPCAAHRYGYGHDVSPCVHPSCLLCLACAGQAVRHAYVNAASPRRVCRLAGPTGAAAAAEAAVGAASSPEAGRAGGFSGDQPRLLLRRGECCMSRRPIKALVILPACEQLRLTKLHDDAKHAIGRM